MVLLYSQSVFTMHRFSYTYLFTLTFFILNDGQMAGLSVVGRDHYGVFPLRGKLLNVREASTTQIKNSKDIENIKKILGLKQNMKYENVNSLRYGHIMIMTDQVCLQSISYLYPQFIIVIIYGCAREFICL